jgi:hypothetical protein
MSSNINPHENMGHAHRSAYVTNVAKGRLDASSISRLRQKTIGSMASRRWRGFIMMELRYEGEN